MPEDTLHTCVYRVLRYAPNLVRDEWVNIGVLLHEPAAGRLEARLLEEAADFARLRRLHPQADLDLLQALPRDFERQFAEHRRDPAAWLAELDATLSNLLQLSPQRASLAEDFEAELDRLYRAHVEPPRGRLAALVENTRTAIRSRLRDIFRRAGILKLLQPGFPVEEFTEKGDPMKLDFAYQRNGTRGFLHSLSLSRDPAYAKVLAYTAERVRAKLAGAEFAAITEFEPQRENERHQFVARLLAEQSIPIVPLARAGDFAARLRPSLR
jgi:hypothetical protein